MKFMARILILEASRSLVAARPHAPPSCARGQYFEIVGECSHPGSHLFFLRAWQEADILAYRNRGPGHDDFTVALLVQHLRQPGRKRKQGLAGAGSPQQADEIHIRIHERIEGKNSARDFAPGCPQTVCEPLE